MVDNIALNDCHYIGTIMAVASIPLAFDTIKDQYISPIKIHSFSGLASTIFGYEVAVLIGVTNPIFLIFFGSFSL